MAKIYYKKYKARIEAGEISLEEALALVDTEVPAKWRAEVRAMLIAG